jgi:two-component system, chemotaxis family, chemotaxis protein CheY
MFKSNARILIVDDIMSMRKLAAGSLKSLGYSHFEEASDGQEALHLLNTSKKGFDLIVSDWNMPVLDGVELLKQVRMCPRFQKIPFFLVTAENNEDKITEAFKAGVSGYILKPVSSQLLKAQFEEFHRRLAA